MVTMARGTQVVVWTAMLCALTGCGQTNEPSGAPAQDGSTRPATFVRCPQVFVRPMPRGFHPTYRVLNSLGNQHMGFVHVYRRGRQQIQLFSGPDLLDKLEDLDLTSHRSNFGPHRFTVWHGKVTPELYLAVLDDAALRPPCDNIGLLTRHVAARSLARMLGDFVVVPTG